MKTLDRAIARRQKELRAKLKVALDYLKDCGNIYDSNWEYVSMNVKEAASMLKEIEIYMAAREED